MKARELLFGLLPFTTGYLILAGILYATGYYYFIFGLNIAEYLEFSEILMLFINYILYITLIFLLSLVFLLPHFRKPQVTPTSKWLLDKKDILILLCIALISAIFFLIKW